MAAQACGAPWPRTLLAPLDPPRCGPSSLTSAVAVREPSEPASAGVACRPGARWKLSLNARCPSARPSFVVLRGRMPHACGAAVLTVEIAGPDCDITTVGFNAFSSFAA